LDLVVKFEYESINLTRINSKQAKFSFQPQSSANMHNIEDLSHSSLISSSISSSTNIPSNSTSISNSSSESIIIRPNLTLSNSTIYYPIKNNIIDTSRLRISYGPSPVPDIIIHNILIKLPWSNYYKGPIYDRNSLYKLLASINNSNITQAKNQTIDWNKLGVKRLDQLSNSITSINNPTPITTINPNTNINTNNESSIMDLSSETVPTDSIHSAGDLYKLRRAQKLKSN
jgi:hypothetical protein